MTFSAGDIVTAKALLDLEVKARRVATQTLTNSATTTLLYDTEDTDIGGFFTPTSGTFTVPTGGDGLYAVQVNMLLSANIGTARAFIECTMGGEIFRQPFGTSEDRASASFTKRLMAAATIVTACFQSSGSNKTWTGSITIARVKL